MPETEHHEQTEPYFELHRNFPNRYRCRRARRLGVPPKTLVAYYSVMHDIASNAGTFGEFTTDVRSFEEAIGEPERHGTTIEDVQRDVLLAQLWRKLELAKVCEIVSGQPEHEQGLAGLPTEFRVRVLGMKTQPRKKAQSGAERTAKWRAGKRDDDRDGELPANAGRVTKSDAARHGDADPVQPDHPANPAIKVSTPSRPPSLGTGRLTLMKLEEIDGATAYEIDRLIDDLRDADDGTRGVLLALARRGAGAADFADARQAIHACSPLKPAAYAVTTITNRIGGAA